MDYAEEMPTEEAPEPTTGEFRKRRTRFTLKLEARAGDEKGRTPRSRTVQKPGG